jgi:hypothetical protein
LDAKDRDAANGRKMDVVRLKPGDEVAIVIREQPGHDATKVRIFYDPARPPRIEFCPAEREGT